MLLLRFVERQYDWTNKGHINVNPYGMLLDLPHSEKEKGGAYEGLA
jgi:hypothetical protein